MNGWGLECEGKDWMRREKRLKKGIQTDTTKSKRQMRGSLKLFIYIYICKG